MTPSGFMNASWKFLLKDGDLVRRKRRGWLALVLATNELNKSVDILRVGDTGKEPVFDNCSAKLLEVLSTSEKEKNNENDKP
jgi:hypothetical protein